MSLWELLPLERWSGSRPDLAARAERLRDSIAKAGQDPVTWPGARGTGWANIRYDFTVAYRYLRGPEALLEWWERRWELKRPRGRGRPPGRLVGPTDIFAKWAEIEAEGTSSDQAAVADALGISIDTVQRVLKDHGLRWRDRHTWRRRE